MDDSFKLSEREHERKYKEIESDLFRNKFPVSHPRAVIMGGQPGSGKSKLLEASKKLFPDGNIVVINGDDLREYHPQSEEIFKLDDKRYAERTDADSRVWTRRLFDRAIKTKLNIIFESTLRESVPISETMKRLRDEGYHLTAKVVATHERFSTTGIYMRYETQKLDKGYGRFTSQASHDAGYEGMPKTVKHIELNRLVDRLEVFSRDGTMLYCNILENDPWKQSGNAARAIADERRRKPTEREIQELHSDWQRIFRLMEERKAPDDEITEVHSIYQKIRRELGNETIADLLKERKNKDPEH